MSEDWIQRLRHEYESEPFGMDDAHTDPFTQFDRWFAETLRVGIDEPNAMVLSTVDPDGAPDSRAVLLKSFDESGFVFFTNYGSRKGVSIDRRPQVALLFLWMPLHRQVRIRGSADRIAPELSDDYFQTRPLGARIGAIASPQSKEIPSRQWLADRYREVEESEGDRPRRPPDWGGIIVHPMEFEFWQGRLNRLHDRIRYTRTDRGWTRVRLAP